MARLWLLLAACAGFTGVALGAFAAAVRTESKDIHAGFLHV